MTSISVKYHFNVFICLDEASMELMAFISVVKSIILIQSVVTE